MIRCSISRTLREVLIDLLLIAVTQMFPSDRPLARRPDRARSAARGCGGSGGAGQRLAKQAIENLSRGLISLAIGVVAFFHEIELRIGTTIAAVAATRVAAALDADFERRQRVRWPTRSAAA